jgi:hypothetical protein
MASRSSSASAIPIDVFNVSLLPEPKITRKDVWVPLVMPGSVVINIALTLLKIFTSIFAFI